MMACTSTGEIRGQKRPRRREIFFHP